MKTKKKRYFLSVVEECIMNENAKYFAGGRIEVYDERSKNGYAVYEGRFWIPIELMSAFRECFDYKELDRLPYLNFDMRDYEKG